MSTEDTFRTAFSAHADNRLAGLNEAIGQLAGASDVTLDADVVASVYDRLDAMPGRGLASWAAAQWPNYLIAWAAKRQVTPVEKTFEAFLAARELKKDDPNAPITGVESYRFAYPGGAIIDVMPSGIYMTTIEGKPKMGDNLEALEIELFKAWEAMQ